MKKINIKTQNRLIFQKLIMRTKLDLYHVILTVTICDMLDWFLLYIICTSMIDQSLHVRIKHTRRFEYACDMPQNKLVGIILSIFSSVRVMSLKFKHIKYQGRKPHCGNPLVSRESSSRNFPVGIDDESRTS